mmetsp:Transcript_28787/g.66864  ORF Transcript_28787/g.66864 Transcript_28787/m.66864 type:complete len:208 (+) Transcript_28787:1043-1666(+)
MIPFENPWVVLLHGSFFSDEFHTFFFRPHRVDLEKVRAISNPWQMVDGAFVMTVGVLRLVFATKLTCQGTFFHHVPQICMAFTLGHPKETPFVFVDTLQPMIQWHHGHIVQCIVLHDSLNRRYFIFVFTSRLLFHAKVALDKSKYFKNGFFVFSLFSQLVGVDALETRDAARGKHVVGILEALALIGPIFAFWMQILTFFILVVNGI